MNIFDAHDNDVEKLVKLLDDSEGPHYRNGYLLSMFGSLSHDVPGVSEYIAKRIAILKNIKDKS